MRPLAGGGAWPAWGLDGQMPSPSPAAGPCCRCSCRAHGVPGTPPLPTSGWAIYSPQRPVSVRGERHAVVPSRTRAAPVKPAFHKMAFGGIWLAAVAVPGRGCHSCPAAVCDVGPGRSCGWAAPPPEPVWPRRSAKPRPPPAPGGVGWTGASGQLCTVGRAPSPHPAHVSTGATGGNPGVGGRTADGVRESALGRDM